MYEHENSQNYSLDFDVEKYFAKCQFWKGGYDAVWQKPLAPLFFLFFFYSIQWKRMHYVPKDVKDGGMPLSWSSGESGLSNLVNYLKDRERVTPVAHLCQFNLQKYKGVLFLLSKNESNY